YIVPFKGGSYLERLAPVKERNPNEFDFSVKSNPLRGLVHLHADTYYLPDPLAAKSLRYSVIRKNDGKTIAEGEITRLAEWYFDEVLTLKDLPSGNYEVTGEIVLKDGKTFGPRKGSFEKKDEAKAFPEWWNNQVGEPERVVSPFTAIRSQKSEIRNQKSKGASFSCWGREYVLNALGLPDSVTSQNGAVLAAPARMVVTVNGKEKVVALGAPVIADAKDWRVRFSGKAEGGGLAFEAEGWMEQDGMVSVDLTYQPKNGGKVRIDALRIEYPLTDDTAECLVSVGPGANFAAKSTMVLPAEKQGRLWSTLDIGRKGSGMKVGSFYPCVWVGGDRRGLLWWADSDQGWFPDDDVPAHEVIRADGAVTLRNNIIGKPFDLDGARQISFTWMASPFKPLPKGWRMFAETIDSTFFEPFRWVRVNPKTGKKYCDPANGNCNWINPESEDPAQWSALWAEQKTNGLMHYEAADARVRRCLPFDLDAARTGIAFNHMSFQLIGYGHKSIENEVFNYFGDEWYADS
ncbi:MAG: DUF6067 family protein, partial [Kiritimatiellae bacterium]|nr:DUF6067 family protein [Kiritimatiellia bacterium]